MSLRNSVGQFASILPITATRKTTITKLVELMNKHDIRHVPVVSRGRLVGIVAERDISVLANVRGIEAVKAEDVMTREPFVVLASTPLTDCLPAMIAKKIGSAIVTDKAGKVIGIFTMIDACNVLYDLLRQRELNRSGASSRNGGAESASNLWMEGASSSEDFDRIPSDQSADPGRCY